MKCRFCNLEVEDNLEFCPACGKKLKKDKFPVWAIVLIVLTGGGCFTLPLIGVVAAMTIPSLVINTEKAKSKSILKKTYSTLNQAYLMSNAIDGKYYYNVDDVWTQTIKTRLNYTDLDGGIKLADGTEIKIEKIKNKCDKVPSDLALYGEQTACAKLTIDTNGFAKSPNRLASSKDYGKKHMDQYVLWMYADKAVAGNGSVERYLMNVK